MNIKLPTQINNQYSKFSFYERIFINEFLKNKELLKSVDDKKKLIDDVINEELSKLYSFNAFEIEWEDNEYLEKEFNNEHKALIERGDAYLINNSLKNKEYLMKKLANKFREFLKAEYEHIVDVVRNAPYENAYKYLILNETLTKIYRKDNGKTLVSKREINKSINDHMIINYDVLEYIHTHIKNSESFAQLYFDAVEYSKRLSLEKNEIKIEGLDTFGKGKWIKFNGKRNCSHEEFLANVNKLKALVTETNWCTKSLASAHLSDGDFYVFVDLNNKPHVAVKTMGNSIDEVRGILEGQRIEPEYGDVVLEFLTKNKNIENGESWLKNQEWNEEIKRLMNLIENDQKLNDEDIGNLRNVLFFYKEYRSHGGENIHQEKLLKLAIANHYIKEVEEFISLKEREVNDVNELIRFLDSYGLTMDFINEHKIDKYLDEDKEIVRDRLKSDEFFKIATKGIKENGGLEMDVQCKYQRQIMDYFDAVKIYNEITKIKNYDDYKNTIEKLFERKKKISLFDNMHDYSILYDALDANVRVRIEEVLNSDKTISILIKEIEHREVADFRDLEKKLYKMNDVKVANALKSALRSAYLISYVDKIDNFEKLENLFEYLYSKEYEGNSYCFAKKFNEKMNNDKIKEIIANRFNCSKEHVKYCDGNFGSFKDDKDMYYYGNVRIENLAVDASKQNIFHCKGIVGLLTYYGFTFVFASIDFPELEYCSYIKLENHANVKIDKLKEVKEIRLTKSQRFNLPDLVKAKEIELKEVKEVYFSSLKEANKLSFSNANKICCENLEKVNDTLSVKATKNCDFSALKEIEGELELKRVDNVSLSSLVNVKNMGIKDCKNINVSSLKNVSEDMTAWGVEKLMCDKLTSVEGSLDFAGVNTMGLASLKNVGGQLVVIHSNIHKEALPKSLQAKIVKFKKGRHKKI